MRETFRSLRIRNYRLYASGQLVSLVGTWMEYVGQDWLILQLTHSGTALGLTLALQLGPTLFLGLYGGLLADRYSKRKLLVRVQLSMGVVSLLLGTLVATGVVRPWMVFVCAGLLGVAHALDTPARQSFVSEMVPPTDVPNAVALNSATFNVARILGPAIAGVVIAKVGVTPVFFVNALSYGAVVLGLLRMRETELYLRPRTERGPGQLREGVRYVLSSRTLLVPMVLMVSIGTFGYGFRVTLALMATQEFGGGGAGTYGFFSSMLAAGALVGALTAARRKRPRFSVLVGAAAALGLGELALALSPTKAVFVAVLVLTGAAAVSFASTANASLQMGSSDAMRGRVMALWALVLFGGAPVGGLTLGWIGEHVGARASLGFGGAVTLVTAVVAGLVLLRADGRRLRLPRRPVAVSYDVPR